MMQYKAVQCRNGKASLGMLSSISVPVAMLLLIAITGCSAGGHAASEAAASRQFPSSLSPKPLLEHLSDPAESITTGTTGPGDVSIELTPRPLKGSTLEVDVSVNTHSVSLNKFDLSELTTLEYGKSMIKPESAPKLLGHHSSGSMLFKADDDISAFTIITITINGIPKVEERVYRWVMQDDGRFRKDAIRR